MRVQKLRMSSKKAVDQVFMHVMLYGSKNEMETIYKLRTLYSIAFIMNWHDLKKRIQHQIEFVDDNIKRDAMADEA